MDMPYDKRRNASPHARVNFSQSETRSLLRGGGGGGVNKSTEKIPEKLQTQTDR